MRKTDLRGSALVTAAIAALALGIAGCSTGSNDQGGTPGSLILSRTAIAVTPGMSETVTVRSANGDQAVGTFDATSGGASIAGVAASGSAVTVTGAAPGSCAIRITDPNGDYSDLAVQVYDPTSMDAGDLRIAVTDDFTLADDESGTMGISAWTPAPPAGYYALGSYYTVGAATNPSGNAAVLVVKDDSAGHDALAIPTSWSNYGNTNGLVNDMPIAGDAYVALGRYGHDWGVGSPPAICVRKDLSVPGSISRIIQSYTVGDKSATLYWCAVEQPDSSAHEGCYLAPGTCGHYIYHGSSGSAADEANNVLCVSLQQLGVSASQSYCPRLTSTETPADETPQLFAKAVLIPCTAISDAAKSVAWQVANSPFYRLERRVFYKRLYFNYNGTSTEQTNSVTIASGVEKAKSDSFHTSTGVSISAEAGVELYGVSAKVTTSLSMEMGYERSSSITELTEKSVATSINTPPGKAVACWQKYNRFILYRHSGTMLQEVASWDIGIDSYVTDQYPD
jgi:hypothetical protein